MSSTPFLCFALALAACTPAAAPTNTTTLEPVASAAPVASDVPVVAAPVVEAGAAPASIACGSRGMAACTGGMYCAFPLSAHCGETDAPGACKARPEMCTKIYAPVCGCDHKTYGSDCAAAAAGISVATTGECSKP